MGTSTARDIIHQAMKKINVLASGEVPTADEIQDALDSLNNLISTWAINDNMTIAQVQENSNIANGVSSISIGSNQIWDTTKPNSIINSFIRDGNIDYPVEIIPRNIYESLTDKTITGLPDRLFYDSGTTQQANQVGIINLYPVSDSDYTLFITSEKGLTEFESVNSNMTFPAYYKRALIFNLAIELAPEYGKQISPAIVLIASQSKKTIEALNAKNKMNIKKSDLPGSKKYTDFYTGD